MDPGPVHAQLHLPGHPAGLGQGARDGLLPGGVPRWGALGSAGFGILAQRTTLQTALVSAAVLLALSGALGLLLHFRAISPEELLPAGDWPEPHAWHGAHPPVRCW